MKIGIFGGTFDPPHIGHLVVAQDAFERLRLERLLFVPAALPPHKLHRVVSEARHRVAMLERAVAGDARFAIATLELERGGLSFTVDTLRTLHHELAGSELVLLLGADQYAEFETWKDPAEVRRLASLAVLHRAGAGMSGEGAARSGVSDVAVTRIDVSSTAVRARVAAGASIRYLVPPGVADYITEQGLYLPDPPGSGYPAKG